MALSVLDVLQKKDDSERRTADSLGAVDQTAVQPPEDRNPAVFEYDPTPNTQEPSTRLADAAPGRTIDEVVALPEPDPGYDIIGGVKDVGKMLYDIPVQAKGSLGRLAEGGEDPDAVIDWKDRFQQEAQARTEQRQGEITPEERAKKVVPLPRFLSESGAITRGDITDTSQSTGFSLASMGPAAAGGLGGGTLGAVIGGAVAGPPGALVGGTVGTLAGRAIGTGPAAYRMDLNMITEEIMNKAEEERGVPLSPEERATILAETEQHRRNHALWEAGPEVISNTFFGIPGIKNIFTGAAKGKIGKVIKGVIETYGGELATETVTQKGQAHEEIAMDLREGPEPTWGEALQEVAPQVFVLTTTFQGAGAAGGLTYRAAKGAADAVLNDRTDPEGGGVDNAVLDQELKKDPLGAEIVEDVDEAYDEVEQEAQLPQDFLAADELRDILTAAEPREEDLPIMQQAAEEFLSHPDISEDAKMRFLESGAAENIGLDATELYHKHVVGGPTPIDETVGAAEVEQEPVTQPEQGTEVSPEIQDSYGTVKEPVMAEVPVSREEGADFMGQAEEPVTAEPAISEDYQRRTFAGQDQTPEQVELEAPAAQDKFAFDLETKGAAVGNNDVPFKIVPTNDGYFEIEVIENGTRYNYGGENWDMKKAREEAIKMNNEMAEGETRKPETPAAEEQTAEVSPEEQIATAERRAELAGVNKSIEDTEQAIARAQDRGDNNASNVLSRELRSLRNKQQMLLQEAEQARPETPAAPGSLGKNQDGFDVFEDENGVRSYVEQGIELQQPVTVVPGGASQKDSLEALYNKNRTEYLTAEEIEGFRKAKETEEAETEQQFRDNVPENLETQTSIKNEDGVEATIFKEKETDTYRVVVRDTDANETITARTNIKDMDAAVEYAEEVTGQKTPETPPKKQAYALDREGEYVQVQPAPTGNWTWYTTDDLTKKQGKKAGRWGTSGGKDGKGKYYYDTEEEAQAALDEYAKEKGLKRAEEVPQKEKKKAPSFKEQQPKNEEGKIIVGTKWPAGGKQGWAGPYKTQRGAKASITRFKKEHVLADGMSIDFEERDGQYYVVLQKEGTAPKLDVDHEEVESLLLQALDSFWDDAKFLATAKNNSLQNFTIAYEEYLVDAVTDMIAEKTKGDQGRQDSGEWAVLNELNNIVHDKEQVAKMAEEDYPKARARADMFLKGEPQYKPDRPTTRPKDSSRPGMSDELKEYNDQLEELLEWRINNPGFNDPVIKEARSTFDRSPAEIDAMISFLKDKIKAIQKNDPTVFRSGASGSPTDFAGQIEAGVPSGVEFVRLTPEIEQKIIEAGEAGLPTFIDNGAFPIFQAWLKDNSKPNSLTDEQAKDVIKKQFDLIRAVDDVKLSVVAPDAIGFQDRTMEMVGRHRAQLRLMMRKADVIITYQKGDKPFTEILEQFNKWFTPDTQDGAAPYRLGIPANEEPISDEELRAILDSGLVDKIHLLGMSPATRKQKGKLKIIEEYPNVDFSMDASRVRSKAQKGRSITEYEKAPPPEGKAEAIDELAGFEDTDEYIQENIGDLRRFAEDQQNEELIDLIENAADDDAAYYEIRTLLKEQFFEEYEGPEKGQQIRKQAVREAIKEDKWGEKNTFFKKSEAEKSLELLKSKLTTLHAGLDPEIFQAGIYRMGFHIEAGLRSFPEAAAKMIEELGEVVKPFLKMWYNGARDYPGFDKTGMDDYVDVETYNLEDLTNQEKEPTVKEREGGTEDADTQRETGDGPDGGAVQQDGGTTEEPVSPTPEGVAPETVQDDGGREPRTGSREPGGGTGVQGNKQPGGKRVSKPRGGRGRTPKVHTPETGTGSDRGDGSRVASPETPATIPEKNYVITKETGLGEGSETVKYNDNIAAIETLRRLEEQKRRATPEEQRTLARYVGWGGLANAFRKPDGSVAKGWEDRVTELEGLLSEEELTVARNSTQNAHYTSKAVVDAIWSAVKQLGSKGGAILEPSAGTGNFIGLMPSDIGAESNVLGVEYDNITAGIANKLYPQSSILHSPFERLPIPEGSFDLVVGNPPFGKKKLNFRYNPDISRFTIHNQFFLAGIDALKPGGIQAMVVSRYLLDSKNGAARKALSREAKLLGAVRLPETAFMENARTQVVTDIVFLQKLTDAEKAQRAEYEKQRTLDKQPIQTPAWLETTEIKDPLGGDPITINKYFAQNRSAIVGTIDRSGSMQFKNDVTVKIGKNENMADLLRMAIKDVLPSDISNIPETLPREQAQEYFNNMVTSLEIALKELDDDSVYRNDLGELEQIFERETEGGAKILSKRVLTEDSVWSPNLAMDKDGRWYKQVPKLDEKGNKVKKMVGNKPTNFNVYVREVYAKESDVPKTQRLGKDGFKRLSDAVDLLDTTLTQINLENSDAPTKEIEKHRKKLRAGYGAYVKKHGYLNAATTTKYVRRMPNGQLVLSLEKSYRAPITPAKAKTLGIKPRKAIVEEADILTERVLFPYESPDSASSAADALAISLSESGRVDMDRLAELLDTSKKGVVEQLHTKLDEPLIYRDPETGRWETADEYLGGNVVKKLIAAREAGEAKNIEALEKVQPKPWTADQVTATLGSTWVPTGDYEAFVEHLTGAPGVVRFGALTNTFTVGGNTNTSKSRQWNTPARTATQLIQSVLNSKTIRVTYSTRDGIVFDEEATTAAIDKAEEIKAAFEEWVFADPDRRQRLVKLFNEKYNYRVTKQRNGNHLNLPGKVPDEIISMRRHQKNAIWRGIVDDWVLYDHAVGAGKTYTAIARAMERRRMGLSRKPMIVVPNHLVEQFAADVYKLYPGAKLLAASKKDLTKSKRRRLFAQVATGDWDIVIVPHSSFKFVGISPATEERYLEEELVLAEAAIEEAEEQAAEDGHSGRGKPLQVKEAELLRDNIVGKLTKLRERGQKKDRMLTFEQLGVDDLTVDEAHEFKNLFYHSKLNVRGMNPKTGSQKAYDLFNKVRVLREASGSVAFMTGTPISNSAVEMYGLMRYLALPELEEMGLGHFDAWRNQFATVTTRFEPTESGRGLKEVNRIGRDWSNMRSLMDLYYSFSDSVSNEDIIKWYGEDNDGAKFPIPKVKGGGRQSVNVSPTEAQEAIIEQIVSGFEGLDGIQDYLERNAERLRLMDRARKVSLDVRAVDPFHESDEKGGKLERVAENVTRIYKASTKDKGTQLIFLDRSVPKSKGDAARLRKYDNLLKKADRYEQRGETDKLSQVLEALDKYDSNEMEELRVAQRGGWNAYEQLRTNLIEQGIPEEEIRFIQEASTDDQKQTLFDEVNAGAVRVLIGSTPRMGAGTNVQERLVALHHADVTWKPSDIEQREGRIIRQGNSLYKKYGEDFEVEILAYTTDTTVDAKLWSLNATKLKMINGIRHYEGQFNMEFDDADSVSMAEIAAIASGEPLQLERVQLAADIDRLERSERGFQRQKWGQEDELSRYRKTVKEAPAEIARAKKWGDIVRAAKAQDEAQAEKRKVTIEGDEYSWSMAENAYDKLDKIKEEAKADDDKKFFVTIDGKKYKSHAKATDAVAQALGDGTLFRADFRGAEYITKRGLQNEIVAQANEMIAEGKEEAELGSMTIQGIEVEIDYQVSEGTALNEKGNRVKTNIIEFFFTHADKDGNVVRDRRSANIGKEKDVPRYIPRFFDGVMSDLYEITIKEENAIYYRDRAQAEIPALEELVNKEFPKAEELKTAKARLDEVEAQLNVEAAANTPDNQPQYSLNRSALPADRPLDVKDIEKALPGTKVEHDGPGTEGGVVYKVTTPGGLTIFVNPHLDEIRIEDKDKKRVDRDWEGVNPDQAYEDDLAAGEFRMLGRNGFIKLISDLEEKENLDHEVYHAAERMVLTDREIASIRRPFGKEEGRAVAYADFRKGRQMPGRYKRIFQKIFDYIQRMIHAFRPTAASTFREIESGRIWERDQREPSSKGPAPKTINRRDKWFSGSQVVDMTGEPLVVFHGSPTFGRENTAESFTFSYDFQSNTGSPQAGVGFFFAEDRGDIGGYAGVDGGVQHVYLKITNPLRVNSWELPQFSNRDEAAAFRKRKELQGYDGIYLKDEGHWIAFEPTQIKSVLNAGTYSEQNPDIRYMRQARNTEILNAREGEAVSDSSLSEGQRIVSEAIRKLREVSSPAVAENRFGKKVLAELLAAYDKAAAVIKDPRESIAEKQKFAAAFAQKLPAETRARLLQRLSQIARLKTTKAQHRKMDSFLKHSEKLMTDQLRRSIISWSKKKTKPLKKKKGIRRGRGHAYERDLEYLRERAFKLVNDDETMEAERGRLDSMEADLDRQLDGEKRPEQQKLLEEKIDDIASYRVLLEVFGGLQGQTFDQLLRARDAMEILLDEGTTPWRLQREIWKQRSKRNREMVAREITGQDDPQLETRGQASARRKAEKSIRGRIKEALSSGSNLIQSWELMLDKIAKNSGKGTLKSDTVKYFGSIAHAATRNYERSQIDTHREVMNKGMEIFKVKSNYQLAKKFAKLNKPVTGKVNLYHINENEETGETTVTKEPMTMSQLEAAYWYQISRGREDNPAIEETFTKMGFAHDTLVEIHKFMSPELKEWADYMVDEFYQDFHTGINEVYRAVEGIDLTKTPNYVPLFREVTGKAADKNLEGFLYNTSGGSMKKGSLHERVASTKAFRIRNLNDVLVGHIADMNHYKAWAIPSREINSTFSSPTIQKFIRQHYGRNTGVVIRKFQEGFTKSEHDNRDDLQFLDRVRGNVTRAMIGMNPVVFLKQLASIPAYMSDIPMHEWFKYTAEALANPVRATRILKKSTMMEARHLRGFERDVATAMKRGGSDIVSQRKRFADQVMIMTVLGDRAAIIMGGYAVYRYHKTQLMKKGVPRAKAEKAAMMEFEKSTERAQQSSNLKDLGWFQSGTPIMKLFTMFMTAPASYSRQIFTAVRNMKTDPADSAKRLFVFGVLMPTIFQAIADALIIADADSDEDDRERFFRNQARALALGPLNGMPIARTMMEGYSQAVMGEGFYRGQYTPVMEMFETSRETVSDFFKFLDDGTRYVSAEEYLEQSLIGLTHTFGYATGVPTKPIGRMVSGLRDAAEGTTDFPLRRIIGYSKYAVGER